MIYDKQKADDWITKIQNMSSTEINEFIVEIMHDIQDTKTLDIVKPVVISSDNVDKLFGLLIVSLSTYMYQLGMQEHTGIQMVQNDLSYLRKDNG